MIKVAADFYKVNLSEAQREDALGHKVDLGAGGKRDAGNPTAWARQ